jgi:hypothetical protein
LSAQFVEANKVAKALTDNSSPTTGLQVSILRRQATNHFDAQRIIPRGPSLAKAVGRIVKFTDGKVSEIVEAR